ncbi:MAG: glycosyltransferase [Anaerolineales bacterium]|jgi:glycosyltransferase involved in cell wall biosynthesis|nr:glycosyltransferase [Anaerolineales bacterium]HJO33887.1 glycosyltransferase [Anaerolineales bacterium]|tara:strand:+ start:1204 stop:1461 length:258 start_codon:yes stop_codon:yes gene_type:complete
MTLDVNERGSRVVVVLPAYNAAKTLADTVGEIDPSVADEIILIDDASQDGTAALAARMGLVTLRHARNMGYGRKSEDVLPGCSCR